ncbi:MAG TPA: cation:proton antiporter, partial [Burkholderiales bacterium]|nr:cation:proton antiporter [Burkholderiales bacterium]
MNHLIALPIVLPLATAIILALLRAPHHGLRRGLSVCAAAALLGLDLKLLYLANDGGYRVYALGDWPPPFGIVLVLDRLSGLMLALTALTALAAV